MEAEQSVPTDEQLENFVRVMLDAKARRLGVEIDPGFGARMVMSTPSLKEVWLQRHRDLQKKALR